MRMGDAAACAQARGPARARAAAPAEYFNTERRVVFRMIGLPQISCGSDGRDCGGRRPRRPRRPSVGQDGRTVNETAEKRGLPGATGAPDRRPVLERAWGPVHYGNREFRSDAMATSPLAHTVNPANEKGREGFYQRAGGQNLAPLWRVLGALVTDEPVTPVKPTIWKYKDVRPYLMEACKLITAAEAERRVMMLENPGLTGQSRITHSLFAGLQIILPGEIAPAHRHVASALRFIIEGKDAYTAVNGEKTYMLPGDFVITPSWTWHDHGNDGDGPMAVSYTHL